MPNWHGEVHTVLGYGMFTYRLRSAYSRKRQGCCPFVDSIHVNTHGLCGCLAVYAHVRTDKVVVGDEQKQQRRILEAKSTHRLYAISYCTILTLKEAVVDVAILY